MPKMDTLRTFPCKIYRKVEDNVGGTGEICYEWKRKCYGRIKFIRKENRIVVAAFEFWSCHNRLFEQPILHTPFYNLVASLEFECNWVYVSEDGTLISIALSANDFM
jgi:hypothetical protein